MSSEHPPHSNSPFVSEDGAGAGGGGGERSQKKVVEVVKQMENKIGLQIIQHRSGIHGIITRII